jgi:phosphatidylethanolamine/phosphatidyl-N-methylethanolamine N-methyltransferase
MDLHSVEKAYKRYAGTYDTFFNWIFHHGRKVVADKLNLHPGDTMLEVGVGTGLSLPLYRRDVTIDGIDISDPMLEKAREKRDQQGLDNVRTLEVMDAESMSFPDDAYDVVVAEYVVTVSPNPVALVDEMRRVCKPDGEIVIVNHFHKENPVIAAFEKALSPLSALVGFRPHMKKGELIEQAQLEVIDDQNVNLFGYWSMLRCRNNKRDLAGA